MFTASYQVRGRSLKGPVRARPTHGVHATSGGGCLVEETAT